MEPDERLSPSEARRLLARASERDAAWDNNASVAQLRQAAIEAGISPAAFDAALAERRRTVSRRRARRGLVLVAALVVGLVAAGVTLVRSTRVAAARAASAQLSRDLVAASACAIVEIGSDRLEAIARQKHPEALVPERRSESVVIGLVFDTNCTLVAHRVGRRSGDDEFDETAWLGQTLGERYSAPFLASGISEVAAGGRSGPGTPWIVWGVLPSTH